MRKSLFAIGLIAVVGSAQAQNILLHVDDAATTYVSKGTLVYNGGGLQMKGSGIVENHGNFMVSGSSSDSFKTITTGGADKSEGSSTTNFVNRLNEPAAYTSAGVSNNYTYGQLYVSGIPQNNITGIVDQELRAKSHGSYQQIGLPFYDKTASSLSAELGKTFSNTRASKNEILTWDNAAVVSKNVPVSTKLGVGNPGSAYYMLGGQGLDLTTTKIVKGRPLSDASPSVLLTNAGASANFGSGGNNLNQYNERYNSYLQDGWDLPSGAWTGTYGKNIYQFANPYLTNLDLSKIAYVESGIGDGNNLTTIKGVRVDVVDVTTTAQGTGSSSYKFISFSGGEPIGDVEYTLVRPMGTFVVKLNSNLATGANATLNIGNLRRFNYTPRANGTDNGVASARNVNRSNNSVKQLGVIGLDANGKEVGRTYYVVYPNATTGHSADAKSQVSAVSANVLGTFEEAPTGGYDNNNSGRYWLYINEANENDFKGKNIKLVNYDLNKIKSYKFEIRENANLIESGAHALSSGIGFFYKAQNGTIQEVKQGDILPATTAESDLYYGEPDRLLAAKPSVSAKPSRTMVVYNPEITDYVVRFDPDWKKADIEVYDMSGKLVLSKKAVNTSTDFVINLDKSIKASYVVKIVSDKGETVNTKILK